MYRRLVDPCTSLRWLYEGRLPNLALLLGLPLCVLSAELAADV
jgi:hypothetical protein